MKLLRTFSALALAVLVTAASAKDFPSKPITVVVTFPPGGASDFFARVIANKLSQTVKWTVNVENKPGAGGNIGVHSVVTSKPDGHTIVLGQTSNLAINPSLYPTLPYDPVRDLTPVVLVANAPSILVVASQSPYKTLADVVEAAKAKPGGVSFATPGSGTVAHLAGELFQQAAGVKFLHVPFKGTDVALPSVTGGQVELYMASVPTVLSHIKSGKLRGIAVSTAKRSTALPDVPTIAESGYPGFEATTWFGLLVPAGTPKPIVARLNAEINKVLSLRDVREKLAGEGGTVLGGTPEQFASLLKTELVKWAKIVKDSGATVE